MRQPLGHKLLAMIARWSHLRGLQNSKMTRRLSRLSRKTMVLIKRWSYKRDGRMEEFLCIQTETRVSRTMIKLEKNILKNNCRILKKTVELAYGRGKTAI